MQDQANHRRFIINPRDYTLVRSIDSSAFGSVYLVKKVNAEKHAAAKIINPRRDGDEEKYKQMVNREIGVLILCQHPTIIKFLGYSLIDIFGQPKVTIFMQYAKKGSLNNYLAKVRNNNADGTYNNTIGQIILVGIARGMMNLHQHQIVHRDLKTANVLLNNLLHPLITDFGLSKFNIHDQLMEPSQDFGSAFYLAPECISGDHYNKKADVYSFGIIMYEIVTKSVPYPPSATQPTVFRFLHRVSDENLRPIFNVQVKPSIKNLIESCWSANPEERPTFEEIFKKLAYNSSDFDIDVYSEETEQDQEDFYMEGVDAGVVQEYANSIDNPELTRATKWYEEEIANLRRENEQLRSRNAANATAARPSVTRIQARVSNNLIPMFPSEFINERFSRTWDNCDPNRRLSKGGRPYYYPVGFRSIGLRVNNFDENTCVAYQSVKFRNIESILRDGFRLPSDIAGHNAGHINFDIANWANAIFVTPSWRYASLYGGNMNITTSNPFIFECRQRSVILLQVRVRPNSFTVHPNTTLYTINDPHYRDDQIEWRIQNPNDVFPYRILIKTFSDSEFNQLFQRRNS